MKPRLPVLLPTLLIASVSVSGCAGDSGRFPSLLPRDIEKRNDLDPVRTAPEAKADASLDATIAASDKRLAASAAKFTAMADKATATISAAANADPGSEPWLDAHRALSDLDAARGDALSLAADLDQRVIARANDSLPPYPALDALRTRVQAEIDSETKRIEALRSSVKPA